MSSIVHWGLINVRRKARKARVRQLGGRCVTVGKLVVGMKEKSG